MDIKTKTPFRVNSIYASGSRQYTNMMLVFVTTVP